MKAAFLYGKEDIRVRETDVPEIGNSEILLKVKAGLICGTDLRMYKNGAKGVSEDSPLILGHELAGVIERVGKNVKGYSEGMAVAVAPNMGCGTCDRCVSGNTQLCSEMRAFGINIPGAFADYVVVPEDAVRQGNLVEIRGISFAEAAMAEPLSCVYNAYERYQVIPGDFVLIVGAGPIGLMHARIAKMAGAAKVIMNDLSEDRLARAEALDPDLITALGEEVRDIVDKVTRGHGIDAAVTAAPSPAAQAMVLDLAALNGRVSFFGGIPKDREMVPLNTNHVHYKQVTISGTSKQSLSQYRKVLELLETGLVSVKDLVTHTHPLDDIAGALSLVAEGKGIKHSISL